MDSYRRKTTGAKGSGVLETNMAVVLCACRFSSEVTAFQGKDATVLVSRTTYAFNAANFVNISSTVGRI